MKSLTIAFVSCRGREAEHQWFLDSLHRQLNGRKVHVMRIEHDGPEFDGSQTVCVAPKPCLWSGKHRITSEDWWSKSNSCNTAIVLCQTEWIAMVDDRSVLAPSWLDAVEAAMEGNYVVCGSYEKRRDMVVKDGRIVEQGTKISMDNRWEHCVEQNFPIPHRAYGHWLYGCSWAAPMEWILQVGGFEEALDSLSAEDTAMGVMLANNGYPIFYDMRAHLVEDRTPGLLGRTVRREDAGQSPLDKSHRALELFNGARNTSNRHLLLQSRQAVLAGKPFPRLYGSREDWWSAETVGPDYMTSK